MTDSVFDIALEKRFTDSAEITSIDVTSADTLLIRDNETGVLMKLPVSVLTTALSSAFSSSFASLVDGKVPASQLPSFVDDVLEYANIGAFPVTGESGKIYVSLATNLTYRWSGSAYIEISASPGSTDSVPEGGSNKYYTDARARAAVSASGSLSYNPTTGVFSFTDAVTSVAGKTGAVTLAKGDVGLSDAWQDANCPATLGPAAHQTLKSGMILQAGAATTGAESSFGGVYYAYVDITFPTAFTSTNYRLSGMTDRVTAWLSSVGNKTTTGCRLYITAKDTGKVASTPIDWTAVGY